MTCFKLTETHHTQEHFPSETSPKDQEVRRNDQNYKEQIKQYHDKRYRVTQFQLEVGQAVISKREKKLKAETPYEPHIYLVTKVKGSTIYARRLSDGKTICQDASRFKLLKTDTFQGAQTTKKPECQN